MRLLRRADIRPMPWKNGGGLTREIAVFPQGAGFEDFVWRISLAEVAADGPFSAFPGIDRTLTVIGGRGIALDFSGGSIFLGPGAPPLSFPGEATVAGRLPQGAILDLNVMTRRGRALHQVVELEPGAPPPSGTVALVARERSGIAGTTLEAGDSLLFPDPEEPATEGRLLAVAIRVL